uniref:Cytochrome c oxidase subunit 3 n=1 Tax=Amphiascoides atopus TaxID=1352461 RepID=W8DNB7_9MAXI|nr:cytochrome c oxidase subunit III [Amphiascoides atopus]AHB52765.1 cytochrome c oxidase subunit III [Amphiascoides atopus]
MSNLIRHPYHLVDESPWPLISTIGALFLTLGLVKWFHTNSFTLMFSGLFIILLSMVQWWRDVSSEGTFQGTHSSFVELGLRYGMILFITSEVLFFMSFFWAFFHSSLAPTVELGSVWPPLGIVPFNPLQVPLLNTIILLSSGISVTWAHHSLMAGDHSSASKGLSLTVILGIYFTLLQAFEYYEASFSIADSAFGTTFFVATGFHGLHVIIGTLFLLVCAFRLTKGMFSPSHHFGFEAAAWYWHFVDVVWLFLYVTIYWWGGN